MKAQRTILITLLLWWVLPTKAGEFDGIIVLKQVSSTDRDREVTTRRQIESHILLDCRQDSAELKCSEREMSVYRENPRRLAVWGFVAADGKLTREGRIAYKEMLADECIAANSMKLETAGSSLEYVDLAKNLKRAVDILKDACASEEAAARMWANQLEDEAGTCSINGWGPYDRVFKQVGEHKWIRSVRGDDLIALTSGPLLNDGTVRGWTYVSEGIKDPTGKAWKYVYKGVQVIHQRGFEFSSLKDCRKILVE